MNTIVKGTVFKVPYKSEFLANGWIAGYDYIYLKNSGRLLITDEMLSLYANMLLTVTNQSNFYRDWYYVNENTFYWPVQVCLDIIALRSPLSLSVKATDIKIASCTHIKGSTPLMGWHICKHCGINLEKWGI